MRAVINAGQSLSDVIDLFGITNLAFHIPAVWTTANLTFQGCDTPDGTFVNIYDSAGNELTAVAAASRLIVDIPELLPVRYLKIRSGTTGTPVLQAQTRNILIHTK